MYYSRRQAIIDVGGFVLDDDTIVSSVCGKVSAVVAAVAALMLKGAHTVASNTAGMPSAVKHAEDGRLDTNCKSVGVAM